MRAFRRLFGIFVASFVLSAFACSAGERPDDEDRDRDRDGDDGSAGAGPTGSGASGNIDVGNTGGSGSSTGGKPNGEYIDPPVTTCETAEECCEKIDGCTSASQFVCTTEGLCGEIRGSCDEPADCQGDSLCCTYPDCLSVPGDGVCIPGNVAPNTDCEEGLKPGVFSPSIQCEWPGTTTPAVAPTSVLVMTTPLVANLPNVSGTVDALTPGGSASEIVIVTTTSNTSTTGVIRILDGETCELKESITLDAVGSFNTPALADLDADGDIEIVARLSAGGVVAYTWDEPTGKYKQMWKNTSGNAVSAAEHWGGLSIHDIDDDDAPEVLVEAGVYDGLTGATVVAVADLPLGNGLVPTAADLDGDGTVELLLFANGTWVTNPHNWTGSAWAASTPAHDSAAKGTHFAYADFGTQPDGSESAFVPGVLDGIPEVVTSGGYDASKMVVTELKYGKKLMEATTGQGGGHPNIGDFDGDGVPEIGIAGGTALRVYDFDCPAGCTADAEPWVRWKQSSQDATSRQTSATLFDFDGDGSTEVVYADECFLRVYDGSDGAVLYSSYRNSGTWLEGPLVADVDRDDNTEIVINNNITVGCPALDPIHPGIVCETNDECPGASSCTDGYCRCSTNDDCRDGASLADSGLSCAAPVAPATGGNVCRAAHPGTGKTGIRVLRDRLDRWASSGSIWNQQNFTITNVNADGTIPRTSEWKDNWSEPGLNNFRQNAQGKAGADALPDITGAFSKDDVCVRGSSNDQIYLQATVCNRGDKGVGSALPATFYEGPKADGKVLCTSYTDGPVPTGSCKLVWCAVGSSVAGKDITIEVNDDGKGGRTTVECHPDNNSDAITVGSCAGIVIR